MMPARRRAGGRRPGRRISDQLRLIVAVPLVAVVAFAGLALYSTVGQVQRTGQLHQLVALAAEAGHLGHALQQERAAATAVLASTGSAQTMVAQLNTFTSKTAETDVAIGAYRLRRSVVPGSSAGVVELLDRIDSGLNGLASVRTQVRSGPQTSASAVAFTYRILSADLIGFRESIARAGAPVDIAGDLRAAAALAQAIDAVGQQEIAVLRAIASGLLSPALRQEITATRVSFVEAAVSFTALAKRHWLVWWERAGTGEEVLAAQRLQDRIGRLAAGDRLVIDAREWVSTMAGWADRLFEVQHQVDQELTGDVTGLRADQVQQASVQGAGVALALILATVVTSIVARRITRRLRRLHDEARSVAYERLPAVVAELRAAPPGTVRPDEVAERATAGALVTGIDEVAEVAEAFRAVHREAIRTAAEQAVMRSNVAEIFVHLSRREQRLVDAVLAQVDLVERDETDPDRLQRLYRLDHLATRMARINLSLLVLGGSGVARVRPEDVPLGKVLQAGMAQIEHYTRVRFGVVDDDVVVLADAVDEVVHLIAELLDNATGYSPPESEVWVTGRALGDRVIVQIADEGVGLPMQRREQLNRHLQSPPPIDVAAVRAMGLTVVGHIAARYGIRVDLRAGPTLGTIAEVTLPPRVFRTAPPAGPIRVDSVVEQRGLGNGRASVAVARATAPIPPNAPPANKWPAAPEPANLFVPQAADTTELPIFREVNGWFTNDPGHSTVDDLVGTPGGRGSRPVGPIDWVTAADDGWRAAARAAQPQVGDTTPAGLPVREPQQYLVPGSADAPRTAAGGPTKRDPAAVAAAMSAYARGVAGRRTTTTTSG